MNKNEIELKEFFYVLMKRKLLIGVFTGVITIFFTIYAYQKTPIYEAKALIEIGEYTINKSNMETKVSLDIGINLTKRVKALFIDLNNYEKQSKVIDAIAIRDVKNLIEIKAEAISNELAIQEINNVVKYIYKEHSKVLNEIKKRRELEIENLKQKINNIKNTQIIQMKSKIMSLEKLKEKLDMQLVAIDKTIYKQKENDPIMINLKMTEKSNILKSLVDLEIQLFYFNEQYSSLSTGELNDLYIEKNIRESLLLPHNYKNSKIVGDIVIKNHPIRPLKKIIIIVAFISSLLVSIVLALIYDFILLNKKEEDS